MNTVSATLERPCPSCGATMLIEAADQVEGCLLRCLHCNAEAVVTQEWDERLGAHHWTLEDSDEELPPERM